MREEKKFKLTVILVSALCVLGIAYNVVSEYLLPDIEGYVKRRFHFERVISKKGLSMHEAEYWREAPGPGETGVGNETAPPD
jgi:hypothetical protein